MEFVEIDSPDPLTAGMRIPISFNTGRSNELEIILPGSNGNSVLFGGAGSDIIMDSPFSDILIGGDGHDILISYFGADIVLGGDGNDLIRFRTDGQILVGGSGADRFEIAGIGNDSALITDFNPNEGDRLGFDQVWLKNFISGDNNSYGEAFKFVEFSYHDNNDGSSFTVQMTLGKTIDSTMQPIDLVRIQYHGDESLKNEQSAAALGDLRASLEDILNWNMLDNGAHADLDTLL
jgi:hypothetical protein